MIGTIVAIATFPGIIVHELSHYLMCKRFNVKVYEVDWFSYVMHEKPKKFLHTFLICVAPLLLGTVFAAFFMAFSNIVLFSGFDLIFAWIGFSCAVHSFPSEPDIKIFWTQANARKKTPGVILSYPIAIILFCANALRMVWFDFFYAISLFTVVNQIFII